jgi:hypothetical protein
MLSGRYFRRASDGEISFLDLRTTLDPNIARKSNLGLKWAYFVLVQSFLTGLNGAFLGIFFRICDYWAYNQEWAVFRAGKPACLNLFGWRIVFRMGWWRRN